MISNKNRFHGYNSLDYVYRNGRAVRSHLANIRSIPNKKRTESRVAVVVSKKVVKSAVKRNTIRRRVYEYIRSMIPKFDQVYDVVIIIGSSEILGLSHADMTNQINTLLKESGLIK